jgi:hypothetical protein
MRFTTIANARIETGLSYLGNINSSSKTLKSKKVSHQYTYMIYLAPASTSGYNVCSHSTPECRLGCLATSGRSGLELTAGISKIKDCRITKTKLFYEQPEYFMDWLIAEIKMYHKKAIKDGYYFSVRLNGTSDIDWQNILINNKTIFQLFPDVQFYDYTKNYNKFKYIAPNYHLTYSYTGRNWQICKSLLNKGINVAMVFNVKNALELPAMYNGYEVINGDLTDYRIADAKGIIIGLKFKNISNKQAENKVLNSCFVVDINNIECTTSINELSTAV